MERRQLGRTSLQVSVIGMGTWRTYDADRAEVQPITDAALTQSVTFFDSSPMYGAAERMLALTLGARRERVFIATKVWATTEKEGRDQIRRALEWYKVVDLYQIHNLEAWETHLPYLEELKAQGKVRAIGVTHYEAAQFSRLEKLLESGRIDAVQLPYNPWQRDVERLLLPLAGRLQLGVILMRPLGEGALVTKSPPAADLAFLSQYGLKTWPQALLNWGVSDPRATVTIPATSSVRHVAENCAVGSAKRFDADARERVTKLAGRL
jgi:aryl-alcohol dehydrogenase-like predicted oxidoreductase